MRFEWLLPLERISRVNLGKLKSILEKNHTLSVICFSCMCRCHEWSIYPHNRICRCSSTRQDSKESRASIWIFVCLFVDSVCLLHFRRGSLLIRITQKKVEVLRLGRSSRWGGWACSITALIVREIYTGTLSPSLSQISRFWKVVVLKETATYNKVKWSLPVELVVGDESMKV